MHCHATPTSVSQPAAEYVEFFTHFNEGRFFEAHEVLEELWLEVRHDADGNFYKGLIQFAAAFVHWQEGRPGPAAALLRTASGHLARYPQQHHGLDVAGVRQMAGTWIDELMKAAASGQSLPYPQTKLELHRNRDSTTTCSASP